MCIRDRVSTQSTGEPMAKDMWCVLLTLLAIGMPARAAGQNNVWYPCPVYSYPGTGPPDNFPLPAAHRNLTASCINLTMPLSHFNKSEARTITMFLKRVHAPVTPSQGQIWLLAGGPGCSGAIHEANIAPLLTQMPAFDVLLPDHRGVGRSDPLECLALPPARNLGQMLARLPADGGTSIQSCYSQLAQKWGREGLTYFNTAEAAADVAAGINRTVSLSGPSVFVYGNSYGSYWANRFLTLFPDVATGVAIDGICPPDICKLTDFYDTNSDTAGMGLLNVCTRQSSKCRAALTDTPAVMARYALQMMASNRSTCATRFRFRVWVWVVVWLECWKVRCHKTRAPIGTRGIGRHPGGVV
eukprot:TRINITY_DN13989_c0_g1_i1.p1 TRINITY_DN13989_c0_g1~~TRINITY_DN13989_c0_g1_i1.p1  ORF type:complete len:357 (+),score=43.27 TRINITY_DN13989_c0_g1_i1:187-1257(+)